MKEYLIENYLRKDGKLNSNKIRYINDYDYKKIINLTHFLSDNSTISERIYCIINDINYEMKCKGCGVNKPIFDGFSKGYRKYCSQYCSNNDVSVKKKKEDTFFRKYGNRIIFQNDLIKNKIRNTIFLKYGVNNISDLDSIKNKKISTCNKNFGVNFPTQSEKVIKKIKKNNNCNYGTNSHQQIHIQNYNLYNDVDFITNAFYFDDGSVDLYNITNFFNVTSSTIREHFKKLGLNWKVNKSKYESEITEFIESARIKNIIVNSRKIIPPYEIDIFLPDYNLAIEFDGLYWHKDRDKNYHLNKTIMCNDKNIELLHIFENEWINKNNIWKSIIKSKLNINNRIYARNCEIRNVDPKTKNDFLDENHLYGRDISKIKICLYYKNEIISLMTFGKPRFNKNYEWEMIRFCNKRNYNVVGAASKLLKYFISVYKPKSIISYADAKYSNGNLYKKIGFTYIGKSSPNYFYFKNNKILGRIQCQKHKLNNILENFDENKTEIQNMVENGWNIIYDCGNYIYKWIEKDD